MESMLERMGRALAAIEEQQMDRDTKGWRYLIRQVRLMYSIELDRR